MVKDYIQAKELTEVPMVFEQPIKKEKVFNRIILGLSWVYYTEDELFELIKLSSENCVFIIWPNNKIK